MTEIDFDKLERPVQDSLLDSMRAQFAPRPILVRLGVKRTMEGWLLLAAAALLALVVLCLAGYGDADSPFSIHPVWVAAVYVALAGACALGVIEAMVQRARQASLPFVPGLYLFPANLIDARQRKLCVYPLTDLASVAAGKGTSVVLDFKGHAFEFPLPDAARVAEAVGAVEAARDALAPLSERERTRLDPLAAPVVASPLTAGLALRRAAPTWERLHLALAVVAGLLVGGGAFLVRNALSDARMLAWARGRDDVPSYEKYLVRGQRGRDEVSRVHLPRAALRVALQSRTVESIEAFKKAFPATEIPAEVQAARQTALAAELAQARSEGTFTALFGFAEKYPDHGLGPELEAGKKALYARALARYKAGAAEPVSAFLPGFVAASQKIGPRKADGGFRGPAVEVRFRHVPSKEMDRADSLVRQNPMFNGTPSLPSEHLVDARFEPMERETAQAIVAGLGAAIDPEVAVFTPGARVDGAADLPASFPAPTLVINYRVEPSGAAYATKKPRGIFLGLLFFFTTDFVVPGGEPLRTKVTSSQRVPVPMLKDAATARPGTLEAQIYQAMSKEAFAEIRDHYLAAWTKKGEAPPK
ncbi:MAG: hypothetical protein WKG00_23385 [Polyangiaceae bacterium]